MHKKLLTLLVAFAVALMAAPSWAASDTTVLKNNFRVLGNLQVDGTSTQTGATTQTGNQTIAGNLAVTGTSALTGVATLTASPVLSSATVTANGDTITIQDLGNANFVQSEGAQTVNGVKTFGSAPVITGGLPAAQIQSGSAKRQVLKITLSPITGAAVDSTVYRGMVFPGRAGTITRITVGCQTPPTVGTDVIKLLKGSSAGNTLINAATFDANTLTANQGTAMTLTATGADLGIQASGANSGIYAEYSAGTQTVDAIGIDATIEYEPTDF